MRSLKRKNKRKVSVISKSNINKNIIKNVIRLHLSRKSDTGQFKQAELGAGQYHAGAGSNPFVSFPSLSYAAGSADAFPGLLSGEQTANQVAVAQMRSADKRNDITTGGAQASNSKMNTFLSPAPAGSVQGRTVINTPIKQPVFASPSKTASKTKQPTVSNSQQSKVARETLGSNRKMNEQLESLIKQASPQSKQASSQSKQASPQSNQPKQTKPPNQSDIAQRLVRDRLQPGIRRDIKVNKPYTPKK
jgi:hypothetical protein